MTTHKDLNDMSDEEFAEQMVPSHGDQAMAGAFLAAQERLDPAEMLNLYLVTAESGRLFQVLIALGETTVRLLNLRGDPEAREALRLDINTHTLTQAKIDNLKGDNAS